MTSPTAPSQTLLTLLRRFEGCHKVKKDGMVHPYICPAGYPTQGYGRLVKDMTVPPITREQAEAWLVEDAQRHLNMALRLSPSLAEAGENRIAAVASFVFNVGTGKYKASTFRKRVDAEDWEDAAEQIKKWKFGGGKVLPGLVIRREAEALLLLTES